MRRQLRETPRGNIIELPAEANADLWKLNWPERRKDLCLPAYRTATSKEDKAWLDMMHKVLGMMDMLASTAYRQITRDQLDFLRDAVPTIRDTGSLSIA